MPGFNFNVLFNNVLAVTLKYIEIFGGFTAQVGHDTRPTNTVLTLYWAERSCALYITRVDFLIIFLQVARSHRVPQTASSLDEGRGSRGPTQGLQGNQKS